MEQFYGLDKQAQEDLIAWFNVREEDIDNEDRQHLFDLFHKGQFLAWNCPECDERVYVANPDDWGNFQGSNGQDYVSYPGNAKKYSTDYLYQLCDDDRSATMSNNL